MAIGETPRACFRVLSDAIASDDELRRLVTRHLQGKFPAIRLGKIPLLGVPTIRAQAGQRWFSVLLKRSKYDRNEWILLFGPSEMPKLWDLIRGNRPADITPWLIQICREIHESLIGNSGIADVRWYFEDSRGQSKAVATPEELPWRHRT